MNIYAILGFLFGALLVISGAVAGIITGIICLIMFTTGNTVSCAWGIWVLSTLVLLPIAFLINAKYSNT